MIDYGKRKILKGQPKRRKRSVFLSSGSLEKYAKLTVTSLLVAGAVLCASYYAYPMVEGIKKVLELRLENFEVKGNKILKDETVLRAAGIDASVNALILSLEEIQRKVKAIPFVKNVEVMRVLPHTLMINIVEREPFAILESGGFWYVDEDGTEFKEISLRSGDDLDFPVLTGVPGKRGVKECYRDSVLKQSVFILKRLLERGLLEKGKLSEINFCEIYGFSFYTGEKPMRVVLGFEDIEEKLSKLGRVLARMKGGLGIISLIDLDYGDKAVVQLRDTIGPHRRNF